MARVRAAQAAEAQSRVQHSSPKASNGPLVLGGVLGTIAVLAVVGVIFSLAQGRAKAPTAEAKEEAEPAKTKKPAVDDDEASEAKAAATAIDRSKFKDLQGCTCKSGKDTRQLAIRIDVSGMGMTVGEDDGMVANFDLSWLLDSGSGAFFLTHDKDAGAPPRKVKGRALGVGVACSGDVVAIVAKDRVTGWSIKDKKMLWDEKLDADYSLAATPSKTALAVQCAALPVTANVLRVPIAKGKTQAINVTNGAAAK
jgi:hypothetical protein